MGGGKGSSSSQVQVTPEQRAALAAQTDALTSTFLPAYKGTIGKAEDVYGQVNPAANTAAQTAMNVAGRAGALQEAGGSRAYVSGMQGLEKLFSPQYKEEQIQASMQPAREEIREQVGSQNAMFGAAGGAGSTRSALARRNLSQLGEQRLGTVAAATSANVESQRQRAAESLLTSGQTSLGAAQSSAASRIGYAQSPQDTLAKYASIVYGTPQASTTPNFAGTQGQKTSSKGFGI
jgi:inorganic triphosphatase YgiF